MNNHEMSREELCMELKNKIRSKKGWFKNHIPRVDRYCKQQIALHKDCIVTLKKFNQTEEIKANIKHREDKIVMIENDIQANNEFRDRITDEILELTALYNIIKLRCNPIKLMWYDTVRTMSNFYSDFFDE